MHMAAAADSLPQLWEALKKEKYIPSEKEIDAVARCTKRKWTVGVKSFVAAGAILWSVTGRQKLMERLFTTFVGGCAAASLSFQWTWTYCPEEILALDDSYLQKRMVAVLQKESVHKPHLRALLEKHYYVEPLYSDSGQATPGVLLRKRQIEKDPELSEGKTSSSPKEVVKPTLKKESGDISSNIVQGHGSNPGVMHDDAFGDGFKGLLWSEREESSELAADGKSSRRHRDRMGVLERREYNRACYLEWQEKRKASGQDVARAEL